MEEINCIKLSYWIGKFPLGSISEVRAIDLSLLAYCELKKRTFWTIFAQEKMQEFDETFIPIRIDFGELQVGKVFSIRIH
jgi:hypothetical protein